MWTTAHRVQAMGEVWQTISNRFILFYKATIIFFAVWWLWPLILGAVVLAIALPFLAWGWFLGGGYQYGGHSSLTGGTSTPAQAAPPTEVSTYNETPEIVERLNRVDIELHDLYLRIDQLRVRADEEFAGMSTIVGEKWRKLAQLDPDVAYAERFEHLETLARLPPNRAQDDYRRQTAKQWADQALMQLKEHSKELDHIEQVVLQSPPNKVNNRRIR